MNKQVAIIGDCVKEMKKRKDEICDIIIIDPPYNIKKDFGNNNDNMKLTDYIEWSQTWISESMRLLKPTGTMYIYGFPEILAHISSKIDINKQRWLCWHYTNKTTPSNKFWQRSFESILAVWKCQSQRIFNVDQVREPYTESFIKNAAGKVRKNTKGRFSNGKGTETIYKANENGALPRDVINIPALAGGAGKKERFFLCKNCNDIFSLSNKDGHIKHHIVEHPTQKPVELTKKLILAAKTNSKNQLLIPFCGTGSELYVAKIMNIDAVGFDINPDYITMANILIKKGFPINI